MNRRDLVKFLSVSPLLLFPRMALAQGRSTFSGNPVMRLLAAPWMELIEDFSFRDPNGLLWFVPKGYKSNGASIPRRLWAAAGSPWSGDYRDAAIIHDYFCDTMERPWAATHKVFEDAMLARGISTSEAKLKYLSVYYFGPRWNATHRWDGILRLNYRPRGQQAETGLFSLKEQMARSIADSHKAAWEASVIEDFEAKVLADGPTAFDANAYVPPTTFNYDTALSEATASVNNFGQINGQQQLIIQTDEMLKYQDFQLTPDSDAALQINQNSISQIEALNLSRGG